MVRIGKAATFSRSAELAWEGDVVRGSGEVTASGGAFDAPARFPSLRGEPEGTTSPEELFAASHASCFGIGLRSVIGMSGASATRLTVRATITAEKGPCGIQILRSHLSGIVEGLRGATEGDLPGIVATAAARCTISTAIRGSVEVTHDVRLL